MITIDVAQKTEKYLWIPFLLLLAILAVLVTRRLATAEAAEPPAVADVSVMAEAPAEIVIETAEIVIKTENPVIEAADEDIDEPAIETGESRERQLEILALIIYQEQGGDYAGDDARMAVGSVFVNRVTDPRFPSTFEEVALQKQAWGELYWTGIRWPERANHDSEARAISCAFDCARRVLDGERTVPEGVIYASEFVQGQIYAQCGNTYFCY